MAVTPNDFICSVPCDHFHAQDVYGLRVCGLHVKVKVSLHSFAAEQHGDGAVAGSRRNGDQEGMGWLLILLILTCAISSASCRSSSSAMAVPAWPTPSLGICRSHR